MYEAPWERFRGKNWDADGQPVLRTQRPPDVTDLPVLNPQSDETLPDGISLRLLDGNWYGSGPEIVVLHEVEMMHVTLPLWARKQLPGRIAVVQEAVRRKRAGVPPIQHGGTEGWDIPGSFACKRKGASP